MPVSRVYLSPGLFGFSHIGAYTYFSHLKQGLANRFRDAGRKADFVVVEAHPTASLRRRAAKLLLEIQRTSTSSDCIHLVGHSTGGLDARLVASPSARVSDDPGAPACQQQIRSVTCINTPHYGTPLASFFATVSGQRLLYVVSALTFTALRFGAPPLAVTSSILAAFGRVDRLFGLDLSILDRLTEKLVRALDDASSRELRTYLQYLRDDQGAIIQVSPEAMDLFHAGVEDHPDVAYQCSVSYAPTRNMAYWARSLTSPWANATAPVFATMSRLTGIEHKMYPCTPPLDWVDPLLARALGHLPPLHANDGVVPVRSQVWGKLVWAGYGDHLDVMGHFRGNRVFPDHFDWMKSGADFDRSRFDALLDAIAWGMLAAEKKDEPRG